VAHRDREAAEAVAEQDAVVLLLREGLAGQERVLPRGEPFSCMGRGFFRSCMGRRMSATAANLMERVLPQIGLR
jgi:hypothetical protein